MPAKFELIAPCFFGCESTANFELRRIGAEDIRVSDGRLTFKGGADMIAAANLNLRTVERVMLLLNTYPATTFDELFDGVYSIPWEELLPSRCRIPGVGLVPQQPALQRACLPEHHQKGCGQAADAVPSHLRAARDGRGV